MLLEDEGDETRPRGCKYPTPPCALGKYYPCAPSFVKSRMLRPLQTHFLLFQQIFSVLVCVHPGTARVPRRVLASGLWPLGFGLWPLGQNPAGAKKNIIKCWLLMLLACIESSVQRLTTRDWWHVITEEKGWPRNSVALKPQSNLRSGVLFLANGGRPKSTVTTPTTDLS